MNELRLPSALIALFFVGCGTGGSASDTRGAEARQCGAVHGTLNNGPLPEGCVKTEGGDLGQTPAQFTVGASTLEITGWTSKNGEGGEYVGFTYVVTGGPIFISVKAGGESYLAEGNGTWTHPNGTSGSEASAISNIVFCPGEQPPGGGEEPGGGNDPGGGGEEPGGDDCGGNDPGGGGEEPGGNDPGGGGTDTPCTSNSQCANGLFCAENGFCSNL